MIRGRYSRSVTSAILVASLFALYASAAGQAQKDSAPVQEQQDSTTAVRTIPVTERNFVPMDKGSIRTFSLVNLKGPVPLQEVANTLRAILDINHISPVASRDALIVRATPEQLALAEQLIKEMDKPVPAHDSYRLDYTISEMVDGKKVNSRTYTVMCQEHTTGRLKVGSRIPIVTHETSGADAGAAKSAYIDVGMNIDARLEANPNNGLTLTSNVDMSTIADPSSNSGNPVLRQFYANSSDAITLGKPLTISAGDDIGNARQFQVQVVATKVGS